MGLLEKSNENKSTAEKCLALKAYNAGISRAYYAAFQGVEYVLKNDPVFNYEDFLKMKGIIPQGKPCTRRLRRLSAASCGV